MPVKLTVVAPLPLAVAPVTDNASPSGSLSLASTFTVAVCPFSMVCVSLLARGGSFVSGFAGGATLMFSVAEPVP